MITITLRRIMYCNPCYDPIERGIFDKSHDLDAPITFLWLSERITHNDVVWCFANLPDEYNHLKRHFAVDCAERVKFLMQDERSLNALCVARKHVLGQASDDELMSARDAAEAALDAARDAARASRQGGCLDDARDAADAARCAARCAAWDAARCAARDAVWVSSVAAVAAEAAVTAEGACSVAEAAERPWQSQRILELTGAGEWSPVGEKE